jgi:hypothetical protein
MVARRRRATAKPRWGWSGAAPLTAAQLSLTDIELETLLPGRQNPIEQIALALCDLGGRYHRYLHQAEFGPTRAERMAALRLLLDQLNLLSSRLDELPGHLRLWLSTQLVFRVRPIDRHADNFEAYSEDEEAVRLVGETTANHRSILDAASMASNERLMDDLGGAAEKAIQLLSTLDTTTASALAIDTEVSLPEVAEIDDSDLVNFATACARIERLQRRVEQTLDRLEHQGGPAPLESIQWLVWELCELYGRETGQPITNSPISKGKYTGKPQSPAGRFVLAAVKALQPAEAWTLEPDHRVERRARVLDKSVIERATLYAMRKYVAHHSPIDARRGRWKRVQ